MGASLINGKLTFRYCLGFAAPPKYSDISRKIRRTGFFARKWRFFYVTVQWVLPIAASARTIAAIYSFSAPSTASRSGRTVWIGDVGLKQRPRYLEPLRLLRALGERMGLVIVGLKPDLQVKITPNRVWRVRWYSFGCSRCC